MRSGSLKEKNANYYAVISSKVSGNNGKTKYRNLWLPLGKDKKQAQNVLERYKTEAITFQEMSDISDIKNKGVVKVKKKQEILLSDMIKRYVRFLDEHRNVATKQNYEMRLNDFMNKFLKGDIDIHDITTEMVEDYSAHLKDRGLKQFTRITNIGVLNRFFKHLIRKKLTNYNPVAAADKPKKQKRRQPPFLTKDQYQTVLSIIDKSKLPFHKARNKMIIEILIYTGLRREELASLKWSSVDFSNKWIKIIAGKGNKDAVLPLANSLSVKLKMYNETYPDLLKQLNKASKQITSKYVICDKNGEKINGNAIFQVIQKLKPEFIKKHKDVSLTVHIFRHTFCTWLFQAKVNIVRIQKLMRHESIEQTRQYMNVSLSDVMDDVNEIDKVMGTIN